MSIEYDHIVDYDSIIDYDGGFGAAKRYPRKGVKVVQPVTEPTFTESLKDLTTALVTEPILRSMRRHHLLLFMTVD